MLDTFRRSQRWLTGIFIFVIGGVFVFFLGLGGSPLSGQPAGQAVVEIGDIVVSRADFLRLREAQVNRFQEALGDQFDNKAAAAFIDSQTMRQLVDSAVLAHAAQELGFTVTRNEIGDYLRGTGQFRGEDGRFDVDAFNEFARWTYGSQRAFMTVMRQDLLGAKLRRLIYNQPIVTEAEARSVALHRLQGVQLGYVSLDTETLPTTRALGSDTVESYLAENQAAVRAVYEERSAEFVKPEARRARHMLFSAARSAGETTREAARKNAEDALQRVVDGADFEDVALELSQDFASRGKGGDIGYVERNGESLAELEAAIYELEPGGEMRVIQTDAGFHVVRVDEIREGSTMAFEEVSIKLARELASVKLAREFAEGMADELAVAVREGRSLEEAARAAGVSYFRSPTLRRRADGYMPEVGTSTDMMATAFSLTEENPTSPRVFPIDGKRTLIELVETLPPEQALLDAEILNEKEGLLSRKRDAVLQAWLEEHRNALNASEELLIDSTITAGS